MGSQTPTNNDRSRTYWTQSMERYFIDLMLDHMHRGNRIGHTFNKQAWTEMLTVFNARFGSQYDKDVIKSRYSNLWKQFNDVKLLLGQSGFSWDESRQMVVAEECVWDAYTKDNPDARSYKTKVVLNFDDMCLIYGYTSADGRYSRSSHDIDVEDEIPGDGMANQTPSNNEHSRTDWTLAMDQYFIDLMLDQLGRGNKKDEAFNKQAWTDMLTLFNTKYGAQRGKRVLRHRYKKMLKYYSDMKTILEQDGFSWDETQQMIIAHDDIWDAYIKAHSRFKSYRTKSLPNYRDLSLIYGDATTDGSCSVLRKCKEFNDDILDANDGEVKENQPSIGYERSRTFWTPPMDRHFIDLLLDQVYKGNKLGQTFVSQAWIDMALLFNAKFNSHHDKDVLKNRYKHLKRQYNDITNLLNQNGFSWDETREMVTAKDSIWDAYTKEHPDARSYRVKTVPSYHKLSVIYGQENYDRRYSRLACTLDSAGEIPVPMSGEEKDSEFPSSGSLIPNWSSQMDRYFIDLMLEQVHRGHKIDDISNELVWAPIFLAFNERFDHVNDKRIMESRYTSLMKEYSDVSNLLSQNGFTWDQNQQIIVASNDIWEAYIKEHPDAISYRNQTLENYNDLRLIFGNENSLFDLDSNSLHIEIDHNILEPEANEISEQSRKRPTTTQPPSTTPSKLQKTIKENVAKAFNKTVKKNMDNKYAVMENAIDALQAIPDLDDDLLLDACDLIEDEKKAKTFLALEGTLRKKWLLRKLRP